MEKGRPCEILISVLSSNFQYSDKFVALETFAKSFSIMTI